MKVTVEHDRGMLIFRNEDNNMELVIDTHTNTVEAFKYPEWCSVQKMSAFVTKVKSTHNTLLKMKESRKFMEGLEENDTETSDT